MTTIKQPKALYNIFLTEMWERFSYYGITALLILYINKSFNLSKDDVYSIYGAYGALVYMTPLLGGYISDKWLGAYHSVLLGAALIVVGHFVVAVPDSRHLFFYLGLAIVIVGTGFFTPSINACLGQLYKTNDVRRDGGFTLAYMGRNFGTILAPLICAYVAAKYDWRYAFVLAGIGMIIGMKNFASAKNLLSEKSFVHVSKSKMLLVFWISLFATLAAFLLMLLPNWVGYVLFMVAISVVVVLIRLLISVSITIRKRMIATLLLTAFYVVFMVLLQQSGGALNLFTEDYVRKEFFQFHLETGMFQSVEPLALVLLTPLFIGFWAKMGEKGIVIADGVKFALGLSIMASSFFLLAYGMQFSDDNGQISMLWINLAYLLQAMGELFIGPIGLAMVSNLIPNNWLGLFMGVWVLAQSIANFLAAKMGAILTPNIEASSAKAMISSSHIYQSAFIKLGCIGFFFALILLIISPWIVKLINEGNHE